MCKKMHQILKLYIYFLKKWLQFSEGIIIKWSSVPSDISPRFRNNYYFVPFFFSFPSGFSSCFSSSSSF